VLTDMFKDATSYLSLTSSHLLNYNKLTLYYIALYVRVTQFRCVTATCLLKLSCLN